METKQILRFLSFCALLAIGYGCSISGTTNWNLIQTANVLDTHEGVFEERPTTDILRVINAVPSNNLNNGPYVDAVLIDSTFVIRTNDNFRQYEEYETAQNFTLTVTFECAGSNPNLVFFIMVTDTNNNDPIFRPEDIFEFTVMPPLPPGFTITNFLPLTVRDIDLTTQRIDFEIFDSTNFAIAYDDASSTTAKEFRAALSTTTFIRNILEPIEFTIRATDVDLTGDPRRSRIATVRIISDGSFELPEELVFTQTFYMADLNTENNEIVLQEPISLRQGYHEEVQFSLSTGEHSSYFEIAPNGNSVTLRITEPIPTEVLSLRKLFLIVRADRQYTSGTSATVILQLPEEINLQFENPIYVGTIEDDALQLSDLVLSQGYENQIVSVEIKSDYSSNFGYTIADNRITLTMSPLDDNIIQQNTFLNLKVVASTPVSSASTVVTLEIIKDDSLTPVFEQALYTGTYDINDGLSIEQITLIQGFDDTVEISLSGDHKELFQLVRNGPISNLVASTLPPGIFREQQILLTIEATKPRTVGATAAISISLPPETLLEFEQLNYKGEITDNILAVEDLVLRQGYENEVINVEIQHEHSSYFNYVINENRISLSMSPLDVIIIAGNSFLNLVVVASTSRSSASTTVTLDIVKDDTTTPAFERAVYSGSYDPVNGLRMEQITILQGYDNTVEVALEGEHREYFQLIPTGPNIEITTSSVPVELFPLGSLLLTIVASKPRTVGANAAISISLPAARELRFSQEAYRGTIQDNNLILGPITISTGYADDIRLTLSGDYESYFQPSRDQNQISIQLTGQLPESAILENNFLLLTLLASAPHAISTTTTISLEIIKEDTSTPVFNEKIYNVVYSTPTSLVVPDIFLTQGYDENVSFRIAGEHAEHFAITPSGNGVGLSIRSGIPEELIFNEKVLVFNIIADKPLTVGARAAISVSFSSDLTEPTALAFSKNIYTGSLRNDDDLVIENIELNVGFTTDVQFSLNSEYEAYFQVHNSLNTVTISLTNTLPPEILNSKFIALELNARRERAVPVTSTVIIDIIQPEAPIPPLFSGAFYRAVYTNENVLQFEREIYLAQGFDNAVSLELEGDYSAWFEVTNNDYVVLITTNGVPESILDTNNHLVFAVVAHKTGAITGRATIVVDLPTAETPEVVVLGFTQASYTGRIQDNTLELPPVTLAGIYDMALALEAEGDYAPYFKFTRESSVINVELSDDFPSEESSNLIVIDLQISYPDAITGFTTLVIELVKEPEVQIVTPVFEQAYYVGQYSEQEALMFAHSIQLIQGFDETVSFSLEGEDRIYFNLTQIAPNSYSLTATDLIQQIDNNRSHLLLSVVATKPGTVNGEAAIVIALTDSISARPIRFAQDFYLGTIDENNLSIDTIILEEGYSDEVQFDLHGEYADYFEIIREVGMLELRLKTNLPTEITENSNALIFSLEASNNHIRTHTTIILELLKDVEENVILNFSEIFYVGSYSVEADLVFEEEITLSQGYDNLVQFSLEREDAEWFDVTPSVNGAQLVLRSAIPPAVLANRQQLIFVLRADRPGSMTARATIVIQLIDDVSEGQVLGFERINYLGSLEGDTVNLAPIVLSEGFTSDVQFNLLGDLASFFTPQQNLDTITLTLRDTIPEDLLPSNRLIVLQLQATAPQALPAYTTLILAILADEVDPPATIDLVFAETYYIGSYTAADGLSPMPLISLAEGYDASVEFDLEGENAQWFRLDRVESGANLALREPIPPAVLANQQQLVFVLRADRPGSMTARATIVIQLIDDVSEGQVLGFERINYLGSLEGDTVNLAPIVLSEGFTSDVQFNLLGDLASFFTPQQNLNTITLTLRDTIPEDLLPSNRLIVLQLQATAPQALPAYTTLILAILADEVDPPATIDLVFAETYYIGSYTAADGLSPMPLISLAEGYDASVEFDLEGENAQWFRLDRVENGANLALREPIPPAVLANQQQLVFVLRADRPGNMTARATIVIQLIDDVSEGQVLGFERINYLGSLEGDTVNLAPIVLSEGFTSDVQFNLLGDLVSFFTPQQNLDTITLTLRDTIPEDLLPSNRLIVLQLQATAPQALPAYTTLILAILADEVDPPATIDLVFAETYYIGSYTAADGLSPMPLISLAEGYDASVEFDLEGENAQWFRLDRVENGANLALREPIPPAVLANQQQLVFVLRADRPGSVTARATIVIQLIDDVSEGQVLGFERINYLGSLEGDTVNLAPIVLSEGFTSDVQFNLLGDLASFFTPQQNLDTITLTLRDTIPEDLLPSNRLIVLQLQATAPQALPAYTTLILAILADEVDPPATIDLVFAETYYIGSYTAADGLSPMPLISLAEGYDASVEFDLEGENAQWFRLDRVENGANLALREPIPPAVLANQQQLVFVLRADRPGSMTARATIVIQLIDDVSEGQVLGFERINYLGSLEGDTVNLAPIVLSEGFTSDVQFNLLGDLASFFTPQQNLDTITLTLRDTIPEDLLPSNRLIVLQLQATAPQALPAYTTLILAILADEVDPPATIDLVFAETYYIGSYTAADGLSPMPLISLAEGYDASVEFDLEGENAQWFRLDRVENGANLALREPIPPAVLANQQQLVFVLRADRPGSVTARATIVIQLIDDVSEGQVLGFERINYLGSLEGDTVNLAPIVLSEGFTSDVQFNLLGDLASFFTPQQNLDTITLTLRDTIPEDLLPSNRLIVLQLQATAPQALPAYTTLILAILADEVDPPATIDLVFAETYYIGSYTAADGLSPMPLISLAEGYDASVEFDLEGENAQWFRLDRVENGANLALREPIPPAVLANQQQLVFVLRADRPGSMTARATIVIQLIDDVSEGQVLGFERINYLGSLEGDTVNLAPIVLSEGFTSDVQFNLLGDLASFFTPQQNLDTITLTLRDTIPEDLLPSNRLIVLQLQATAPQALPAYTTLILAILADEVDPPATIDLVFAETYYIGSYTAADGLSPMPLISLAEGYDASVEFDLEGENAQWFRLDRVENGANLALREPIPPAVLANQQQLVFVLRADRPGSMTARATIVIQLIDDVSEGQVLGFERINYLGSLEGDTVNLAPIVLSEGFTSDVQFNLLGDLASFFTPQQNLDTITLTLRDNIPEDLLPSNRLIVLQLQATAPQALPAYTTLILAILADEVDPPATIDLVFAETYYIGSYTAADGLSPMPLISLAEGYDASVEYDLEGENAQWFRLDRVENGANLALREPIPPAVLANQQQLVFVLRADRPGSVTARATIVIQLIDDVSEGQVLGFERINYLGSLEGDTVNLAPIVLSEGFTSDVQFNLLGDLASFFTPQQNLDTITLTLRDTIPEDLLPSNRLIVLQLQATAPQALPAYTTLILAILADEVDPPATIDLVFAETYYIGSYTAADGLSPMPLISLAEGYDASVEFDLEGENAQWFRLDRVENGANLALREPIPPAVLANQQQLVFVLRADRPGSMTARATIVIQLIDDVSEGQVLGFERINYLGSLEGDTVNLAPIVLSEGFTSDVQFNLLGDLASFFTPQQNLDTITLTLRDTIPEDLLPSNRLIVLQLQATAPLALPAYTTLILAILADEVDPPATIDLVFAETYYIGSYTAADGLSPMPLISLAEGYDASVEFDLEGENAQWFRLDRVENGANLALREPIPPAVLANQQQLVFVLRADRPGSMTARATIVIQLIDDVSEGQVLGFERINYLGSLEGDTVNLAPIVLSEGFTSDVQFNLLGDLASFFTPQQNLDTITLTLRDTIPEDLLPSNRLIVLQLQATAPQALPAYTTLILAILADEVNPPATIDLVFAETYYIGSYTAADGLSPMPLISLAEGYDASVEFDLEGENAQWFRLDRVENGANLALREPIPPAVLANQQQLVFVLRADRPGSMTARATIVIQLIDDVSEGQVLGFERINYLGSLEGDTVNLAPIVLSEGFTSDVQFNLLGDLASFFTPQQNLDTITLTLRDTIPEDLLPSNRLIVLQLQATAPQALPAYTTLILAILADEVDPPATIDLVFAETYYIGSYTAADGLSPMPLISLAEGYDSSVEFHLEGENAQWFRLDRVENGANLALREPIPPAVLANQQQLVFVLRADRPGSMTARATIVIQLIDDVSEGQVLGFERINYLGSLEGDTVNLAPIVLSEGFTSDVQFNLLGDLASFFTPQQNLDTITLTLRDIIPEDLLPSNRLIVLQLQATAPQALPAYTTLILAILADEVDPPATIDLVFAETYYIGSYTAADGLSPMPLISLAEGYDASVEFHLEGENAQWFRLDRVESGANLALREPIPPAVLANQQQLVFVLRADRPGSMTARATIVIQLIDDVSEGQVLGFERINYLGSLEGDTVNLVPIVLSEGFTSDVQFNLLGDLASFFTPQQNLDTITLTLRDTIPEDLLPSNRLIVLQLQATAPQALPAYTTLILAILADEVDPPATIDLVFAETYYIGSYTAADGLSPMPLISLAEGYDASVEFDLEGENAQWFRLDRVENGANLALREPIPPAVLANQQQLVFVVRADRPGSMTARAIIVIQLNDGGQEISVTFDNVLYKGRIQGGVVQHETITLSGYEKDQVDIFGTYGSFFTARHSNGLVVLEPSSSLTLPDDIQHVVLELRADDAASVLVLDVVAGAEPPVIPTVSFSSTSYAVRVEMGQTGAVGQVEATADNGERVTYSLRLSNEHLQSRLSVSSEGELRLSAPADIGVYNFEVIATTVFTGATGSATINFAVEAIVTCGDDIKTAPLIVIDRDEEEAHRNLVVIDPSEHDGCQYSLTNLWPADHNWLYVDETGLHAHIIDREDPAIAFMALSQIQVELTLHCNTETRTKRSTRTSHDWLGPYDYGSNTWLLGNSIEFNPRRTIVNLIVNDINDNMPKFDQEELTVGYPVADLASTIAPRALIELRATDADVGENAALVYWSPEPQLAVSPLTGLVHVRNDSALIDGMELSVSATDRNGQGLSGTIILTVKLLSTSNIAVLTVDNAFLEDEALILRNLSNALGYEVKSLRSDILPDSDSNQEASSTDSGNRKKREVTSTGASLVIHVYGLIEREPVIVERLSNDINENAGSAVYTISSIITLEEHLAGMCTISGGNVGLLVATIVLSVLLFLIIAAAVVLFIYVRRKGLVYEKFSDTNSLASKIESPVIEPKPDGGNSLPRLNIEELKRSERRLQDMLHAPIKEVVVEPSTSTSNSAIIPAADTKIPIIIQDKLKDIDDSDEDEFGERKKGRRKSVVTFNENVEKIIHVEDNPEESVPAEAEYEIYKL